ncbi:MAG: peptidoglycan-binding protein [Candidatus Nealsonbacteria bacterium]|nr:MAG: peptidoglycan-binding protein [Candidatus Nealsonbacteria bacterium]
MNLITKKKIIAIITVLTVWGSIATPAFAITVEELQTQIATLLATINALQTQLAALQGTAVTGCTITSFDQNLKQGMSGDDVKCLQIVLNSSADTQLAASGVGSPGNETSYFGPITKAAVIKFQEKYASEILTSWGLTVGTGFVGSTTRAKLNTILSSGVVPGPVIPAAGLSVSLATDTPASTGVPYGSSVEFLKFTLVSGEDVNINSIEITAGGIGIYTNIDSVAIFDEDGIRISSTKNISSDGSAIFNFPTPLVVEAGVLQILTVKATAAFAGAGHVFYLGISDSSDILSNASAVNGTFPINGNPMNVLSATVGTATIAAATDLEPSVPFGEDDVLLADFDIDVGAAEDLLFSAIRFRNGGTNDDSLASNLRLICDGEEIATTELEDRYAAFSISNILIEKSDTVTCEVRGDIGTGSAGDTIKLYIKDETDVTMICKNTGFRAAVDTTDLDTTGEAQNVTLAVGDFTIDFDKSSITGTPNQDVRPDTKNVVIATLKMTSNAENATIESITTGTGDDKFEIQGTGIASSTDITTGSIEMRDVETGAIYDLAETWVSGTKGYLSMTEEISLVKGVTKTFEIRLDLTSSIGNGDTLKVVLEDGAFTITGDVSGESITDILPNSITSGISTVEFSSLDVTTVTLTDVSVVGGAVDKIIYQASLEAGDSSPVTLKTVAISEVSEDSNDNAILFSDTNITKLDLYLDGDLMKTRSNKIAEAAADSGMGSIAFSSLDTNNVISAGKAAILVLKATFASSLNASGTFALGITNDTAVISRDIDNELIDANITSTSTESRTVTLATVGDLKVELKITDVKANKDMYIVAGSSGPTGRYLGELVFTTKDEPVKVTTLRLDNKNGNATNTTIASVSLVEANGTVVETKGVLSDGDVNFTNLDLEFAADEATSLFVVADVNGINVAGDPTATAISGKTIQYNFPSTLGVVAEGVNSGKDITMAVDVDGTLAFGEWSTSTVVSKTGTVLGAAITHIENAMANGTLTGGAGKIIGKYTLTIDSGANRDTDDNTDTKAVLATTTITVTTGGATSTNIQAYIAGDSSNKTTEVDLSEGVAIIDMTTLTGEANEVDGTVTIVIIATVETDGEGDYLQTEIDDLSTDLYYSDGTTSNDGNCQLTISEVFGGTLSN